MAESMSHVERVLWRIAELGARCSQQAAAGGREPLWAELEQTIVGLEAEFEAVSQAVEVAPAQVRSLEGRLKVARQELDQEKAKVQEHRADAEAARRERDRAVQKARKAMAITIETKSAVLDARSTAAECVARASAADNTAKKALAARDGALASRDEAVNALAEALTARDRAVQALAEAVATGERAADARDEALAARDTALRALEGAHSRITELEATLEAARAEQEEAVVVLPGVTMPQAPVGPITSGNRISWQPTWSEWSRPDADTPDVTDVTDGVEGATEIRLDDTAAEEDRGVRRYLNVAATIAQLLPDDLGPLLLAGATVIRREGRLFATVAVTTNDCADTAQASRLADAGFKVEWTSNAPLGV
jgi:tetratricopeptide (TPR) repeat protein